MILFIYLFIYFSHPGPPAPGNSHSAGESASVDDCEADQHYQGNLLDKCNVSRPLVPPIEEWFLCEVHVAGFPQTLEIMENLENQ